MSPCTNTLGEELKINHLCTIKTVDDWSIQQQQTAKPLVDLKKYFEIFIETELI